MYEKFVISNKDLEQFNVCYNDEIICDRDIVAVPGELAILHYELSKDYGIYEGIDAEGYHVMRYLNGRATRVNPREGWTCVARVIAVFRKRLGRYEDVKRDIIDSARFRKVSPTLMPSSIPVPVSELGVFVEHDRVWTTSRDVAEKFEKNHRDVIRSVKNLDCSEDFRARNFALTSQTVAMPNGATRNDPMYLMTRDGFTFLAMGFTGAKAARFKEAYIAEFNRMEEKLYRRRFCGAAQKQENAVMELPLDRTTFSPVVSYEQEYKDLVRKYECEKKRASTAIGNLRTSRSSEEKLRHQLNKALDVIAKMASK